MNLAKTSKVVKILVNVFIGIIVFYYLSIYMFIPAGKALADAILPEKDPPNPIYGVLDPIQFVRVPLANSNQTYVLNTKTGRLPTVLPKKVPLLRFRTPLFSYEAGRAAQNDAADLGFSDTDLISDLTGDIYRWANRTTGSYLEINILSKELTGNTPLVGKEGFFPLGRVKAEEVPENAKKLLRTIDRFGDKAYEEGKTQVILGKFTPSGVVETKVAAEAQIARIDFFRGAGINHTQKKLFPVLGPDAKKGLIHIFLRKPEQNSESPTLNYPKADIYYKEIETQTEASYPIISVEEAWKYVSAGKGVISNVTPTNANPFSDVRNIRVEKVLVNDIYIALYEPIGFTKYALPIYVFEGNYTSGGGGGGTITLYYPALSPEFVKQSEEQESPSVTP